MNSNLEISIFQIDLAYKDKSKNYNTILLGTSENVLDLKDVQSNYSNILNELKQKRNN